MPGRSRPMTRTEWRVCATLKPTCAAAAISLSPRSGVTNTTPLPGSVRRAMMKCRSAPASRSSASTCARPPGLSWMAPAHTSTCSTYSARGSITVLLPLKLLCAKCNLGHNIDSTTPPRVEAFRSMVDGGQRDSFLPEPKMDLPHALQFDELAEDQGE